MITEMILAAPATGGTAILSQALSLFVKFATIGGGLWTVWVLSPWLAACVTTRDPKSSLVFGRLLVAA